jgi:hypothetical protein
MESGLSPPSSDPPRVHEEITRRARVIGFLGVGVCFLVSQVGLLWMLATGGIGNTPSIAGTIWLFSTLCAAVFLLLLADSYRQNPHWLRRVGGTPNVVGEAR